MATPLENLQSAYESVAAKIAEVLANPLPSITVDGVVIDRMGYYKTLLDIQKSLREQMVAAQDSFEIFG